jgi:hypothetical protein
MGNVSAYQKNEIPKMKTHSETWIIFLKSDRLFIPDLPYKLASFPHPIFQNHTLERRSRDYAILHVTIFDFRPAELTV